MKRLHISRKFILIGGALILLLLAVTPSLYFYIKYQNEVKKNSPQAAEEEIKAIKSKVEKHIALPKNEEPVLATVSDTGKLKDQPFFQNSQNGDKVLIYTNARKAYLYRPSLDKLIEVATVNLNSDLSQQSVATSTPKLQEIKIVLRNGSGAIGLTNRLEPEIKKVVPNTNIIKKENAARSDYETTVVVALNEIGQQVASSLAQYFKTTVSDLPADENKPDDADVIIILGRDKAPSATPTPSPQSQ